MVIEDSITLLSRLKKPLRHNMERYDVVIDTDTYNEIDDQYALAYLVNSDTELCLKAIYSAPFKNDKAVTAKEGMDLSYEEINRVLSLMKRDDLKKIVYQGSPSFLLNEKEPVVSDAAQNLVRLSLSYTENNPLYVIAIGAITNVASALLLSPEIKDKIVIIWLGGHGVDWPIKINSENWRYLPEFNLFEDIFAARVVFDCGVPLIQLPCMGVVSALTTSGPELEYWLRGKNQLCDYLLDVTIKEAKKYGGGPCWTREIWDVAAVAWLLKGDFMFDRLEYSPILTADGRYSFDKTRHFIRYVYYVNRDNIFYDLFTKIAK
jgi:inosine-uridine nucleoside N-ribohydrolase